MSAVGLDGNEKIFLSSTPSLVWGQLPLRLESQNLTIGASWTEVMGFRFV